MYSSVACMLGMNDARVMRPDANTIEGRVRANCSVKDWPVASSAPRPATNAICATRPLMSSGPHPPKLMVFMTASFMEGLGGGVSGAGIASSMDAFVATAALEARTDAVRRRGARRDALERGAEQATVMAAMVKWMRRVEGEVRCVRKCATVRGSTPCRRKRALFTRNQASSARHPGPSDVVAPRRGKRTARARRACSTVES